MLSKKPDDHNRINGTFLQTRRFLSYHPDGRFIDHSLLFYDTKGHLAAVCPACEIVEDGKKVFYSHKGSTFGGILIGIKDYKAEKVLALIRLLDEYVSKNF